MSCHEIPDRQGAGEATSRPDPTDARSSGPLSARHLIADLRVLLGVAGCRNPGFARERLEEVGLVLEGGDPLEDQACALIDELPLSIEARTTFEIILGVGAPGRRLCLECRSYDRSPEGYSEIAHDIRRVYYRYSWSGTAEVELAGEDRELAEEFAGRVVPELEG
jgi:hypothetical protein